MPSRFGRFVCHLLCGILLSASLASADTLDDIRQRGLLRWGADREGGGPFVFPRNDDPTQIRGIDVELAELLARRLGVKAEAVQGQWDKLPDLLDRGDMDIVLDGYEWTENRSRRYGCSIPYYLYELQLLVRKDETRITSLEGLRELPAGSSKMRVAVLGGSAAQFFLEEHYQEHVQIVSFDGTTDAMRAVELAVDGIDATLQDLPVVTFYEQGFPDLRRVGQPVGLGYYVILVRQGDTRLLAELNGAIVDYLRDGSLREVLQRYKLWNDTQRRRGLEADDAGNFLPGSAKTTGAEDQTESYVTDRGWEVIWRRGPLLLAAAWITVKLSVTAMPLAMLIGLMAALGRMYGPRPLAGVMNLYVEVVRGTPLVLQLYVIFFLLPEIGLSIHAFWAAIIGLAVNYSAYEAEIYRAGLQAIPRGQMEAAQSLGMSRWLALRRIIVPQATRIVIPPMTNDFIALFKDTAVCSVITVVELSKEYYIHARSTGAILELGLITAVLYLAMSFPLSLLTKYLEKRLARERRA